MVQRVSSYNILAPLAYMLSIERYFQLGVGGGFREDILKWEPINRRAIPC